MEKPFQYPGITTDDFQRFLALHPEYHDDTEWKDSGCFTSPRGTSAYIQWAACENLLSVEDALGILSQIFDQARAGGQDLTLFENL